MGALQPGTKAPDFSLHTTPDQAVALHEFRGRRLILCFYPADWSPVCGDQVTLYNELLSEFRQHNAELLAISVDGVWCHLAYPKDRARPSLRAPDALEDDDLVTHARLLGLDLEQFVQELGSGVHAPRVRRDFVSGVRSGVNGTPSFYINGVRHDGGYDAASLLGALEAPLRAA